MEINSAVGREQGMGEAKILGLPEHSASPLFDAQEKAALAYADALTESNTVSDEIFARLRDRFSDDAIVALTAAIAWEICASKFNRALEIEAQGICLITKPEK